MLDNNIKDFLQYCKSCDFSDRSIESLSIRLKEFNSFVQSQSINSICEITYHHLLEFITDWGNRSVHVKKACVWTLHQFFHFLKLNGIVDENIAQKLPYPKIEKTVPQFLTINEFNEILNYFALNADSLIGLRNLILIMTLGFLGLRTSAIIGLNIEDLDLSSSLIWIREKGNRKRELPMPQVLCTLLYEYLQMLNPQQGPLFLSKRHKRISTRTLQNLFRSSADKLGIDKHLHPHLFRHTAATHLNKVAGMEITQHLLGHARRQNTEKYTHLNDDQYALYMKQHPYMTL